MLTLEQAAERLNLTTKEVKSAIRAGELIASVFVEVGIMEPYKVYYDEGTEDESFELEYKSKDMDDYYYIMPNDAKVLLRGMEATIPVVYKDINLTEKYFNSRSVDEFTPEDLRITEDSIQRYRDQRKLPELTQMDLIKKKLLTTCGTALNNAICTEFFNCWYDTKNNPNIDNVITRLKKYQTDYPEIKEIKEDQIIWETDSGKQKPTSYITIKNKVSELNTTLKEILNESDLKAK